MAGRRVDVFLGLKPQAESLGPFGTNGQDRDKPTGRDQCTDPGPRSGNRWSDPARSRRSAGPSILLAGGESFEFAA